MARLGCLLGLIWVCLAGMSACKSDEQLEPVGAWSCEAQGGRPPAEVLVCKAESRYVKGSCMAPRCDAGDLGASNCCPGMVCTNGGECIVPRGDFVLCDSDADCNSDERCLDRPNVTTEGRSCGFAKLPSSGACAEGSPFNNRCVTKVPCDGSCEAGLVCNIDTNLCEEVPSLPAASEASCAQTCGDGEILVYEDPDNMLFAGCCAVSCVCETLPPVAVGAWGRFASSALDDGRWVIAGYDQSYGDLVVSDHDLVSGQQASMAYVDGYPSSGPVRGDPDGYRGGRDAAGTNVGQFTSVALHNGMAHVAYYDVDGHSLKYAVQQPDGSWHKSLVDNDGDVGRFASLHVSPSGVAHIAYMALRSRSDDGAPVTGLKLARATTGQPAGPQDWEHHWVEKVGTCDDTCSPGTACVLHEGVPTCLAARADCVVDCGCDGACVGVPDAGSESGEAAACRLTQPETLADPCGGYCPPNFECVEDPNEAGHTVCLEDRTGVCADCDAGSICVRTNPDIRGSEQCLPAAPLMSLRGLPPGVGAFASLQLVAGRPTVVYHDVLRGQLRGAVTLFDDATMPEAITGFSVRPLACEPDVAVGQHAVLAVSGAGDHIAVAYQGSGGQDLWVYEGGELFDAAATRQQVDDGSRSGRTSLVGGSAALAYDQAGKLYVIYGDQSENDLVLAARDEAGTWRRKTLLSDGAVGSFNSLQVKDNVGYVSTYWRTRDRDVNEAPAGKLVTQLVDLAAAGRSDEGAGEAGDVAAEAGSQ